MVYKQIKSTKATTCVGNIEDDAFLTSSYVIQWNFLKDHQSFGKLC